MLGIGYLPYDMVSNSYSEFYSHYKSTGFLSVTCIGSTLSVSSTFWVVGFDAITFTTVLLGKDTSHASDTTINLYFSVYIESSQ